MSSKLFLISAIVINLLPTMSYAYCKTPDDEIKIKGQEEYIIPSVSASKHFHVKVTPLPAPSLSIPGNGSFVFSVRLCSGSCYRKRYPSKYRLYASKRK